MLSQLVPQAWDVTQRLLETFWSLLYSEHPREPLGGALACAYMTSVSFSFLICAEEEDVGDISPYEHTLEKMIPHADAASLSEVVLVS